MEMEVGKKEKKKMVIIDYAIIYYHVRVVPMRDDKKKDVLFPLVLLLAPSYDLRRPPFLFLCSQKMGEREKNVQDGKREKKKKKKREREREKKKKGGTPHSGGAEGSSIH